MDAFIKRAATEDIPLIYEITRDAFKIYAQKLGLPEKVSALKDDYDKIRTDMSNKTILIAYINGKAVGTVRYEILDNNIAYISRFAVSPNAHNCGIGKLLLKAVEDQVLKLDASMITLHTASKMTALVRLYYGQGYYIHSTTTDRGYIRALFCKDLSCDKELDLTNVSLL